MNIHRYMNMDAVYWEHTGDDINGQPTYAAPVAIKCYWGGKSIVLSLPNNRTVTSRAMVITEVELKEVGVLWQGLLADAVARPQDNAGAFEILQVDAYPNRQNTQTAYFSYL